MPESVCEEIDMPDGNEDGDVVHVIVPVFVGFDCWATVNDRLNDVVSRMSSPAPLVGSESVGGVPAPIVNVVEVETLTLLVAVTVND